MSDGGTPDDELPTEYTAVRSVDTGSIGAVAVDDARIVLGSVAGEITVLMPDTHDAVRFSVEGRPRGLAVGSLVYVALDGCVCGYDTDGSRRWESPLDGVSAVCWVSGPSQVVAATDAGEFVVLDASDGTERHRIDRAHADVSETVVLTGRNDEFLSGESWYLTGFGADGDRRGEAMLDGTITGLGLLDGVSVVSLHGGRIAGIDAADGTTRWTRHLGVEWIAPRGADGLYAGSNRGLVRISADGEVADVGVDAADSRVVTTTDGGLACRLDGRTAEVLRPRAVVSGVDLEIAPVSLRVDEELRVTVANRGGPTAGTVRVSGEGGSIRPDSRSVSLDADDRATLGFTLADAAASQVTVRAAFEPADAEGVDRSVTQTRVTVPASTPAPTAEAECLRVADGVGEVELTVETPDGSDLPAVAIAPGDTTIDPGQASATRTLSVPLGTDRLTVTTDDADPIDVGVSVPAAPASASVRARDDGFVDVTVANDASVPVDDAVSVTGEPLAAPVERSVSLDAGNRLTLVVPTTRPGSGEIRVDAAAVETAETVTVQRAALPADPTGVAHDAQPRRTGTEPRSDVCPADTDAPTRPGRTPRTPRERASDGRNDPGHAETTAAGSGSTDDRSDRVGTRGDPADGRDPSLASDVGESGLGAAESASSGRPDAGPSGFVDLSRRLESETATEGHAIEEVLTLDNPTTEPRSVTLESGDERTTVEVGPDATATASRYHAGWDVDSIELPEVTARTDDAEARVPTVSIPVESAPVVIRPALSVQSASTDIRLDARNNLETTCAILELGSKGFPSTVGFEGFELAAGATGRRQASTEGTPAERPALTFVRIDRRQRPLQTIAAVDDRTTPPVSVTVDSIEMVGDRDTNVVVRIRNDGGSSLDLRIEATGDAPDDYLYTAEDLDGLDPGADAVHTVECTVDDDRIRLPIRLETTPTSGDDSWSTTVVTSGDRTAEASAWQIDAADDGDTPDLPAVLSTPLTADE